MPNDGKCARFPGGGQNGLAFFRPAIYNPGIATQMKFKEKNAVSRLAQARPDERVGASSPRPSPPQVCGGVWELVKLALRGDKKLDLTPALSSEEREKASGLFFSSQPCRSMRPKQKACAGRFLGPCLGVFLLVAPARADTNLLVAADGSAPFQSVQAAINATPQNTSTSNQVFIHIKPGTYKQAVYVQREKRYVHLLGEDAEKTILTCDLFASMAGPDGQPIGTFRTASTYIDADDFSAENLTFENRPARKARPWPSGWTATG